MTTYGTMKARIADETSASGLSSQIASAIQSAIDHYAHKRFEFNQGELSFQTIEGQTAYGAVAHADIPNIQQIDAAKITGTGWGYDLTPTAFSEIYTSLEYTGNSIPTSIAYHDLNVHLAPRPAGGYTVKIAYIKKLSALSDDADTNAWMTLGEALIRYRAEKTLFNDVLRQYEDADRASVLEMEELRTLERRARQVIDRVTSRLGDVVTLTSGGGSYNIYGDRF